jgi:hypothetical protein
MLDAANRHRAFINRRREVEVDLVLVVGEVRPLCFQQHVARMLGLALGFQAPVLGNPDTAGLRQRFFRR